jgi:hypothetical protein
MHVCMYVFMYACTSTLLMHVCVLLTGALFSWSHDINVLTGAQPREFRVQTLVSDSMRVSMNHEWRELLDVDIDLP